jgi:hypothetical protein
MIPQVLPKTGNLEIDHSLAATTTGMKTATVPLLHITPEVVQPQKSTQPSPEEVKPIAKVKSKEQSLEKEKPKQQDSKLKEVKFWNQNDGS